MARNAVNSFVLGDNMALVLTQCRWRSRPFALIVILRRAGAYILARAMVIVSRWIMSETNTSDAPSRLQEQHQPQDQVMHATDEPAQSRACLARACACSASSETNQRACSKSKRNTAPLALPYSTSGYRGDGYVGGKQAFPERSLDCKGATRNETTHVCLLWKRTCAEYKHRKPPATPPQRTKQKQPLDAKGPFQTKPLDGNDCWCVAMRSTQQPMGWNLQCATWSSRPADSVESTLASLLKFESWVEHQEEKS